MGPLHLPTNLGEHLIAQECLGSSGPAFREPAEPHQTRQLHRGSRIRIMHKQISRKLETTHVSIVPHADICFATIKMVMLIITSICSAS